MKTRFVITALAPAFLMGCIPTGEPMPPSNTPPIQQPAPPPSGAAECSNANLAQFIGQKMSEETGARILMVSGGRVIRWVAPGMAVTMDYRADRVTASYEAKGLITTISCG